MTPPASGGSTKVSVVPRLTWDALRQRYVPGAREIHRGVVFSREPGAGALRLQAPREARVHGSESGDEEATVRRSFGERRLETMPRLLEELRATDDFFFHSADLIRLDRWFKRRVVLVRDAGYPTPLTAWGVSLALIGAYVLAGELKAAAGDHCPALDTSERELRPFVGQKTWKARRTSLRLVPGSAIALRIRNQVLRLSSVPALSRFLARMTHGRMVRESFALKDYEAVLRSRRA